MNIGKEIMFVLDAEKLRIERARKRFTVKELSARSGVSEKTIRWAETGRGGKTLDTVVKLAKALDVQTETLISDITKPSVSS